MRSLILCSVSVAFLSLLVGCGDSGSGGAGGGAEGGAPAIGGAGGMGGVPGEGGMGGVPSDGGAGGSGGEAGVPADWTCDPAYYDEVANGVPPEDAYCDCVCGAVDPDCAIGDLVVDGCAEGQTCPADACEGTPTAWTCAEDQYDGGVGNGCDCNCGAADPDCELDPVETIEGCVATESCNGNGSCVPAAWTCEPDYYGDMAGCDCDEAPGCGIQDPDCADVAQEVLGCDEATDTCVAGLCAP